MPKIEIEFATAGEANVVKAWQAARKAQDDATAGLRAAYSAGSQVESKFQAMAAEGGKAFAALTSQVGSLASSMTGLNLPSFSAGPGAFAVQAGMMGVQYFLQEQQKKEARAEATRIATLPVADAVRDVKNNLVADDYMTSDNVEDRMQKISRDTRTSMTVVAAGLTPAMSAEGSLGHKEAEQALTSSLMLKPNDVGVAAALPGRLLDLANIQKDRGEQVNIPMLAGLLSSTQGAARVQDLTKLGTTYAPFAQSAASTGDSLEQSAELFAGMTTVMKDAMGDKTSTALISLVNQLKSLSGEIGAMKPEQILDAGLTPESIARLSGATSSTERITAIQNSPDLQAWLFKAGHEQLSFEQGAKLPLKNLLTGDAGVLSQINAAKDKVVYGDDAEAAYKQKVKDLESGKFQSPLTSDQVLKQSIEENKLGKSYQQRAAGSKEILNQTLDTVEGGSFGKWMVRQREWWHRDEDKPELAAASELKMVGAIVKKKRDEATTPSDQQARTADLELINASVENLIRQAGEAGDKELVQQIRQLTIELKANTEATRKNTTTPAAAGDREATPGPPPSAALTN